MTRVSGCLAVSSPSPATARQHRKKRDSVETVGEIWTLNIWQIRFSHETPQETFPEAGCLEGVSPKRIKRDTFRHLSRCLVFLGSETARHVSAVSLPTSNPATPISSPSTA